MMSSKLPLWCILTSFYFSTALSSYTNSIIYAQNKPPTESNKKTPTKVLQPSTAPTQTPPQQQTNKSPLPAPTAALKSPLPQLRKNDNSSGKKETPSPAAPPKKQVLPQQSAVWVDRDTSLQLQKRIKGRISPKSVVYSGNGLFFAQNMMYNHSVTVYNRSYQLIKTIKDAVQLSDYGYEDAEGIYYGAPVEAAFSHSGQYAWVSNYDISGKGFEGELGDNCPMRKDYQQSFVYKINTQTYEIEQVIGVGSVPKYVAVSPDNRYVLVSNWCSGDVSVIDIKLGTEIRRITVGAHPRGIVINPVTQLAYIAIMGGSKIAVLNLNNFTLNWIPNVGVTPRHLCLSPNYQYLYVTLNNKHSVAKIDLSTQKIVAETYSGKAPRSMAISADGQYLYVVNYNSNNISKIQTNDLAVVQKIKTDPHPIGITVDPDENKIWVACYSGSIMVFKDRNFWYKGKPEIPPLLTSKNKEDINTTDDKLPPIALPIITPKNINNSLAKKTNNKSKNDKNTNNNKKTTASDNNKNALFPKANAMPASKISTIAQPKIIRTKQSNYCVIGGSFNEQTKYKIKTKTVFLQSLGFVPEIITDGVLQKYRLSLGCFDTEQAAQQLLNEAKAASVVDAWILKQ